MAMKYTQYTTGNGTQRGRSPAEIESDLASIRSEMSATLQRLEARFSPRAVIEHLMSRARGVSEGGGQMAGNLGATLRDNPVPVMLLAAGVASLLASERAGKVRVRGDSSTPIGERLESLEEGAAYEGGESSLAERARQVTGGLGARTHELKERAKERASGLGERAGELRARARERSADMRERAHERSAAMRERMRGGVAQVRDYSNKTIQEEPLVIIGIGLALGAIFGAGAPISQSERRLVGPTGGRVMQKGKSAVESTVTKVENVIVHGNTTGEAAQGRPAPDYDVDPGERSGGGGGFGGAEPPI
jgi:ElaB/YqjD/DUF883 family membrane-anchored ribosome-binding protein